MKLKANEGISVLFSVGQDILKMNAFVLNLSLAYIIKLTREYLTKRNASSN